MTKEDEVLVEALEILQKIYDNVKDGLRTHRAVYMYDMGKEIAELITDKLNQNGHTVRFNQEQKIIEKVL